jgi:ribonuclease T1
MSALPEPPSKPWQRHRLAVAAVVAAVVLLAAMAVGYLGRQLVDPAGEAGGPAAGAPAADAPSGQATPASGLPTVAVDTLPAQARATLTLIDQGGPFPYDRDGTVFGNNEGLLPDRQRGYYREYTVPTPGERDRGARRLVVGRDGDVYYTGDHYESFRQVLR